MNDAPSTARKPEASASDKKKFEVKKVCQRRLLGSVYQIVQCLCVSVSLTSSVVECCCPLGMGHCG